MGGAAILAALCLTLSGHPSANATNSKGHGESGQSSTTGVYTQPVVTTMTYAPIPYPTR